MDTKQIGELRGVFERTRRDAIVFALLTVLLTPFLLCIAGLVFFFALMLAGGGFFEELGSTYGVLWFCVAFLLLALFTTWRGQTSNGSVPWGAVGLVAAVALLVFTGPVGMSEGVYLGLCGGLGFGALALMGRAYTPRDDYYLGMRNGMDDPFTLRDDADRAHVAVGCALAIPGLVLGAFGEVFASRWLWSEIDDEIVRSAARLLVAAEQRNVDEVMRTIGHERGKVFELLERSKLARIRGSRVILTDEGKKLLA